MLIAFFTLLAGALAASPLLIARFPQLRIWIERLRPFAQVLGVILFAVGVFRLIVSVIPLITAPFLQAVQGLTLISVQITLGFLLGFGLLRDWLFRRNRDADRHSLEIRSRLERFSEPLGVVALVVAAIECVLVLFR